MSPNPARYLSVTPLQDPYDLDLDEAGRPMVGFNAVCLKTPSSTFLEELMAVFEAAGVGLRNVSLFASSLAVVPDLSASGAPSAVLHIKATGGVAPIGTHNEGAGALRQPGVQVIVHGKTWPAAYAMAQAAFGALLALRNKAVSV